MCDYHNIEANLRTAMRFFGEASGSGCVETLDGTVAMFSGLDYGVFNISLLTREATEKDPLERRLAGAGRFFKSRTLRWSFWLCEDLLDPATRRRERQLFTDFGMRAISHPPGMLAPALLPPARLLPAIECRPVTDSATRLAFSEITSVAFEIPYTVVRAVYSREQAWRGDYQGYVGLVDGRPVTIVALVAAAGVIGVYSLATLPDFRRRGYGEALLRMAAAQVSERTGLSSMALQSTEAGYELYKRMGFRDATRFTVYLTK
ncbi:MAG TPA: GNAT family N-acetyltransferase [Bryobacteraceae bacterium]|nr:GNAT family N-acetyltransferase [Bryobacteraceae bacterium]